MELLLKRTIKTDLSTIGELYIDGKFECFTLEDIERLGDKVYGKTAIPKGRYEVIISWSNRFKRPLPLLLNVPNFTGIRIHTGNKPEHTEGCLLVGRLRNRDVIGHSKLAFANLFVKLKKAIPTEKIYIIIE